MKWIQFLAISLCLAGPSRASHEGSVDPQSVVLAYEKFGLEIAIAKDEAGELASFKITYAGQAYEVPAEELKGFGKGFFIGKARVLAEFPNGGSPVIQSSFDRFVVSIPYGEITVNVEGGREIHSFDEVRFEFAEGKLKTRRRAVSLGEDKSSWKLLFKNVGVPEQDGGGHQGAFNPYREK